LLAWKRRLAVRQLRLGFGFACDGLPLRREGAATTYRGAAGKIQFNEDRCVRSGQPLASMGMAKKVTAAASSGRL